MPNLFGGVFFGHRFLTPESDQFWVPKCPPNGANLNPFSAPKSSMRLELEFLSRKFLCLPDMPCNMIKKSVFFICFYYVLKLHAFLPIMLLHYLVSINVDLCWVPKTIQKWTPNRIHNRSPFRHVFNAQLCPIFGSFWAPQSRPKSACWAMLAHLAALELHLGTPRSFPSHFGLLRRPLGALRGGGICTPFWPPRGPFRPSMAPF